RPNPPPPPASLPLPGPPPANPPPSPTASPSCGPARTAAGRSSANTSPPSRRRQAAVNSARAGTPDRPKWCLTPFSTLRQTGSKGGQACSVENLCQTSDDQHQVVGDDLQHGVAGAGGVGAAGGGGAQPPLDHAH